jgi:hypothetical protein
MFSRPMEGKSAERINTLRLAPTSSDARRSTRHREGAPRVEWGAWSLRTDGQKSEGGLMNASEDRKRMGWLLSVAVLGAAALGSCRQASSGSRLRARDVEEHGAAG